MGDASSTIQTQRYYYVAIEKINARFGKFVVATRSRMHLANAIEAYFDQPYHYSEDAVVLVADEQTAETISTTVLGLANYPESSLYDTGYEQDTWKYLHRHIHRCFVISVRSSLMHLTRFVLTHIPETLMSTNHAVCMHGPYRIEK